MVYRKMSLIDGLRKAGYPLLEGKYPAKEHCRKVGNYLKAAGYDATGVIYVESQKTIMIEDNDMTQIFRQRRPFYYLSGCDLPDSYLIYDIPKDELTLLIPSLEPSEVVWSGPSLSPTQALERYDCDRVRDCDDLNIVLEEHAKSEKARTVFAISGQVTHRDLLSCFATSQYLVLKHAINQERVVKDLYEVCLIAKANDVSAKAHQAVFDHCSPDLTEAHLEGTFVDVCISNGCRYQAYPPIVASGASAATLHYVQNNAPLKAGKLNVLLDAGAEYSCYCADVTRTFPISGNFSPESKIIYDIVVEMQESCLKMLRAGVNWDDVHLLAHTIAIKGLLACGILRGDPKKIFDNRVSAAFFPHGVGHYLGMDTHDVGGVVDVADPDLFLRYLRVRGPLPKDCVVTVEPGIYFSHLMVKPYLENPDQGQYIDQTVLEKYWDVGGVRIEDNIWVTVDGYENLTTAAKL